MGVCTRYLHSSRTQSLNFAPWRHRIDCDQTLIIIKYTSLLASANPTISTQSDRLPQLGNRVNHTTGTSLQTITKLIRPPDSPCPHCQLHPSSTGSPSDSASTSSSAAHRAPDSAGRNSAVGAATSSAPQA